MQDVSGKARWRARLFFRWYDLWVGAYYDPKGKALYVCPVPTLGLKIWRERT